MNGWSSFDVMVAHESNPHDFRHEATISIPGEHADSLAEEMCALFNGAQLRDCKWDFTPQAKVEQRAANSVMPKLPGWEDNVESFEPIALDLFERGADIKSVTAGAKAYHEFIVRQLSA